MLTVKHNIFKAKWFLALLGFSYSFFLSSSVVHAYTVDSPKYSQEESIKPSAKANKQSQSSNQTDLTVTEQDLQYNLNNSLEYTTFIDHKEFQLKKDLTFLAMIQAKDFDINRYQNGNEFDPSLFDDDLTYKDIKLLYQKLSPNELLERQEITELTNSGETLVLLYGSQSYSTFLGCLNCAPSYFISVWNPEGPYGSPKSKYSIWNDLFEFGSFSSNVSPWNKFAAYPPLMLDTKGTNYGKLSRNANQKEQSKHKFAQYMYMHYPLLRLRPEFWYNYLYNNPTSKTVNLEEFKAK